jgi:hypothetical protein
VRPWLSAVPALPAPQQRSIAALSQTLPGQFMLHGNRAALGRLVSGSDPRGHVRRADGARRMTHGDEMCWQTLIPWHRAEAITVTEAATISGRGDRTIRLWCEAHGIGRRVGRWWVSRPALGMYLEGDQAALAAYRAGDRHSDSVTKYFNRYGLGGILVELQKMTG